MMAIILFKNHFPGIAHSLARLEKIKSPFKIEVGRDARYRARPPVRTVRTDLPYTAHE